MKKNFLKPITFSVLFFVSNFSFANVIYQPLPIDISGLINLVKENPNLLKEMIKNNDFNSFKIIKTIDKKLPFLPPNYPELPYKNTYCFKEAGDFFNIDENILKAIYKVEKEGFKENLTKNKQEKNYGILNFNAIWLEYYKKYDLKINDLLDPCLSLHLGASLLDKNRKEDSREWKYIGSFISKNEKEQKNYYDKVMRIYHSLK